MSKVKILVVEDEVIIADNICDTLNDLGYETLEPAINYTETVELIERETPDIAVLDIQLSGKKTGIDLARKINLNIPDYKFDIDTAIPLGLIINELITNAYKYGFEAKEHYLGIDLSKNKNEDYVLNIKDNGKGLPDGFDFTKAKSLGLRLVRRLSKQLQGSTTYSYNNGSLFSVVFKDSISRAAID